MRCRRLMFMLGLVVSLTACSSLAPIPPVLTAEVLADARFAAHPEPEPAALFAMSEGMHRFAGAKLRAAVRLHGADVGARRPSRTRRPCPSRTSGCTRCVATTAPSCACEIHAAPLLWRRRDHRMFTRMGDLPLAGRVLQQLMQSNPGHRHAAANLAFVWRQMGRLAEAVELEARLPVPPFADFDHGLKLMAQSRCQEALVSFERQLRVAPEFHDLHFQLAQAHLQLGHEAQALQHLKAAEAEAPTQPLRARYPAKLRALRTGAS